MTSCRARRFLSWWSLLLFSAIAAADELRVLRVTPTGEDVPPGNEIVIQFDRQVVPLGRMDRSRGEVPLRVDPDPGCRFTWIDPSALACRLAADAPLVPATRYAVEVRPPLVALDGAALASAVRTEFTTARPDVENVWFESWLSPSMPVLRAVFNQPVEADSITASLRLVGPDGRTVDLAVEPDPAWETAYLLRATAELAADAEVRLELAPGLRSRAGPERSVARRTVLTFRTFPEPRLLGVRCRGLDDAPIFLDAATGAAPRGRACDPLGGVALVFSAPVLPEALGTALSIEPALAPADPAADPWAGEGGWSWLGHGPATGDYPVWLPTTLRAAATYRLRAEPGRVRDEFDRPLGAPIDFTFRTDHRRPRLALLGDVAVLESGVDTHVPVAVTNLASIDVDVRRWRGGDVEAPSRFTLTPRGPRDLAYLHPLRVRDWLDGRSGAVVGTIAGKPAGAGASWLFAEVTPFHVHVKLGHYDTLVWVTGLADGAPVEGAEVRVVERVLGTLDGGGAPRSAGRTDSRGLAELDGAAQIDPDGTLARWWRPREERRLFVEVRRGEDLALVPLSQDFRLRVEGPNGAWIPSRSAERHGHVRAWGVTAQGLYRAGDTVRYKVWLRNDGDAGLEPVPAEGWTVRVVDPQDKVVHERAGVTLGSHGALDGSFPIPRNGAVGWYRFEVRADFAGQRTWFPLDVLVADFVPAPFRVATELDAGSYRDGERVAVITRATLHAGGPYVDAQVRVVAELRRATFRSDDPRAGGFQFDTGERDREVLHEDHGSLDGQGLAETSFGIAAREMLYGTLRVESAVRDDRGKNVAAAATARFAARDRFVGLRHDGWLFRAGEPAEILALVADDAGAIVAGVPIAFALERLRTTASRVKGAGNAYIREYTHSWEPADTCSAVSADGPVACTLVPETPGSYRVVATVEDSRGRSIATRLERWATGRGYVLWDEPPGHALQVVPESDALRVGQNARYFVKNPFPGATALVTVERYGVIDAWLQRLEDSTALIEFPVKPEHLPGFYLSVVVVSPRVEAPPGDGDVDLGKPAMRMGYVKSDVRDAYKELDVTVVPEAERYRPRERARVGLRVRTRQGAAADAELAVAVLDESVLDLVRGGASSFDPYAGLYALDPLDVANFNLVKNLVGLRKFEAKGASPGGGGGLDPGLRTRFEFVAYWNPSVRTDASGEARIEFDLPDNLTAWRVLAIAATPVDRFGLGQASLRVDLPTEVRAALPNQVLEGDRFEARFSVMNRTDARRTLDVEIEATGPVRGRPRIRRTVAADPYRRHTVALPIETTGPGSVRFRVRAGDDRDSDALELPLPVRRSATLEAAASYGSTDGAPIEEQVVWPADARPGVGGLSVIVAPTVLGALEGAFAYGRDYPLTCWEQLLSRAVLAAHYLALREWLPATLEWPDATALVAATLARAGEYQAPNGGMAFYQPQDAWASPYLSAYTAWAFAALGRLGHAPPRGVEERLHAYLDALLRRDVFPSFYSRGMGSSVRAVALAALARAGKLAPGDLSRYREHAGAMDLFGKALFLEAATRGPGDAALRQELLDAVLAHAVESGGKLALVERLDDGWSRLLASETRTACAVLSALVAAGPQALDAAGAGAIPAKLVRTVSAARGARSHWENTQENVFCVAALGDYARAFEDRPPDYTVEVSAGGERLGTARATGRADAPVTIARPVRRRDAGRSTIVRLDHAGSGRAYYAVQLAWAPATARREPLLAGLEIRREYHVRRAGRWARLPDPASVAQGELVRVDLYLFAPGPRNFVVVDDPVPGGLEPVDRDLATASEVDAGEAVDEFPPDAYWFRHDDWQSVSVTAWCFYHRELRHDAARFYSEYLPAGRYRLSYVAQAIAPGTFAAPPTRAGEMYDPDVYGVAAAGTLVVGESEAP